jgi:hypothetical protein
MPNKAMVDHLIKRCIEHTTKPLTGTEKLIIMTAINNLDAADQIDFFNQLLAKKIRPPQFPEWMTLQQLKLFI